MAKSENCPVCGGRNTSKVQKLVVGPSPLAFAFLGLWYLLVRSAFAVDKRCCKDCGTAYDYRTKGSYMAIGLLALLVLAVLLVAVGDGE